MKCGRRDGRSNYALHARLVPSCEALGRSLRLAWRLFAFYLIAFGAAALLAAAGLLVLRSPGIIRALRVSRADDPRRATGTSGEVVFVCGLLVSMYVMARRERRSISDFWFRGDVCSHGRSGAAWFRLLAVTASSPRCWLAFSAYYRRCRVRSAVFANGTLWAITFLFARF